MSSRNGRDKYANNPNRKYFPDDPDRTWNYPHENYEDGSPMPGTPKYIAGAREYMLKQRNQPHHNALYAYEHAGVDIPTRLPLDIKVGPSQFRQDAEHNATLDEFQTAEELHYELYINGLQIAAVIGARLKVSLGAESDGDTLKKWYTWTRGLNQLEAFRYSPARRRAELEEKQRNCHHHEPNIHRSGTANAEPSAPQPPLETQKTENPDLIAVSPTEPIELDQINQNSETDPESGLSPEATAEFERIYAKTPKGPRVPQWKPSGNSSPRPHS